MAFNLAEVTDWLTIPATSIIATGEGKEQPTDDGTPHWHIKEHCQEILPVGSRVTCSPAPTDTDIDYLVLTKPGRFWCVAGGLERYGYASGVGSEVCDVNEEALEADVAQRFTSFKKGDVNYIVTESLKFFNDFSYASDIAKRLNLLDKQDRINLFQIILYDNFGA